MERAKTGRSQKVVSIPVRFVDSLETDRSASALKIQKVFRGLQVRRSMKKILAIKHEVDEIGKRISCPEVLQMLGRDQKERLRVNETLMNLLFRLDSVRGVDVGVKEYRKAVIRKTIALQEKIDAIVAVDAAVDQSVTQTAEKNGAADDGSNLNAELFVASPETEQLRSDASHALEEVTMGDRHDDSDQTMREASEIGEQSQAIRLEEAVKEVEHSDKGETHSLVLDGRESGEYVDISECGVDKTERQEDKLDLETKAKEDRIETQEDKLDLETEAKEDKDEDLEPSGEDAAMTYGEGSHTESQTESSQSFIEGVEENILHENNGATVVEHHAYDKVKEENNGGEEGRSSSRNKELLEKMTEDNEKMMGLMAELFERNREQTRLMATLSQRVEQLERAFVCEKFRRKKKRLAGGHH